MLTVIVVLMLGSVWAETAEENLVLIRSGETQDWFYLDASEVTVGAYRAFDPDYAPEYFKDGNMPATGITFEQARAYCQNKGKRLPTSKEWQLACHGPDRTVFAYGNEYDPAKARVGIRAWNDGPRAVRSYGSNGFGVYDLTGNVWEWVDNGEAEGEKRYIHGGSWLDGPRRTRCALRLRKAPDVAAINYGFRCARPVSEAEKMQIVEQETRKLKAQKAEDSWAEAERLRREAEKRAEDAEIAERARKILEAEEAAERAAADREAEAKQRAEAFARKTARMSVVGSPPQFYIDRREVSVAEFEAFDSTYRPGEFAQDIRMPATDISYEQASAYCRSLGKRLPTSSEWKTACLAGRSRDFAYVSREDMPKGRTGQAWYAGADTVGTGEANALGVTDMVGNVWEWVDGWYDSARTLRQLHGGSWADGEKTARCLGETWAKPETGRIDAGFRCVIDAE